MLEKKQTETQEARIFYSASDQDILTGKASDVYFERSIDAASKVKHEANVVAEFTVSGPKDQWVNFSGLAEVVAMLKGKKVDLYAIPEGTLVDTRDADGRPVPFMKIVGNYDDFGEFETALLGFICQSTGISTYSTRIRMELGETPFFSFGIRRMHPAISPMIDRAAYIGGADGVSGILGAKVIGLSPVGTMPHALSLIFGDDRAWEMTVKKAGKEGVKTLLIDTYMDEKFAAIKAAEMFPDLDYIRLDTPSSRRGSFPNLLREVRWELDLRGYKNVKLMVSGGLKLENLAELKESGADSFGIGTSISSAAPYDFAMDIVELNGSPHTKRGKFSGSKSVLRCDKCRKHLVVPITDEGMSCQCGGSMENLMQKFISQGETARKSEEAREIRERALSEIEFLKRSSGVQ